MARSSLCLLLTVFSGLLVGSPAQAVVHVPGDAPTIQAGINMAIPPDTVLVAPNVYPEHIQLVSGVNVFGADAATTIIAGGGVAIDVVKAISVTNVIFRGFTVTGAISGGGLPGGAGVFVNMPHSTVQIQDVIAEGNDFGIAVFNGYGRTGPDILHCEMRLNNYYGLTGPGNGLVGGCTIHSNNWDGISQSGNSTSPMIIGNTVWGNTKSGFSYWNDFPPTVRNNIFAANGEWGLRERAPGTFVDPIVQYNLFWDNTLGNYYDVQSGTTKNTAIEINGMPNASNNLVDDPLICDPPDDFHLCADSPALGAGMGGADIGAYGAGCGPCGPQAIDLGAEPGRSPLKFGSFPNPLQPATTLTFELPAPARVTLRVYDLSGRLVRALLDRELNAGRQELSWDGSGEDGLRVAAGAYLLDLRAGDLQVARKVTVLAD